MSIPDDVMEQYEDLAQGRQPTPAPRCLSCYVFGKQLAEALDLLKGEKILVKTLYGQIRDRERDIREWKDKYYDIFEKGQTDG